MIFTAGYFQENDSRARVEVGDMWVETNSDLHAVHISLFLLPDVLELFHNQDTERSQMGGGDECARCSSAVSFPSKVR